MSKDNSENRDVSGKLPRGYIPAWTTRGASMAVGMILIMQVTYYATEVIGFSAALTGTLLLVARVFDAFTDLFAGYIVDRTKTRFGKARPYELVIVPLWLFLILLFSTPEIGTTGKIVWFFVFYFLVTAVCQTLLAASEGVLLARTLTSTNQIAKVGAISGVFVIILTAAANIALPILMNTWGKQPGGWTKIGLVYGIPMAAVGLMRFIFIKETNVNEAVDAQSRSMKLGEVVRVLFKNKYIFISAFLSLCANIVNFLIAGVSAYYFTYILGDLSLLSTIGILGLVTPFLLLVFPVAMKKIGYTNVIRVGFVLAVAGNVLRFIFQTSLPAIIASSLLVGMGTNFLLMMGGLFVVNCMDYGEWKTGKRLEGVINSLGSLMSKLGSAIAAAGIGFIMARAGYESSASTQSPAALSSIVALFSIIPAVVCVVMLVLIHFYDLEKKMPKITEELALRRAGS